MTFQRRSLRRRPPVSVTVAPVSYDAWHLFSEHHYLTAELARSAQCYCAFVEGRPVGFVGVLHFPHPTVKNIKRFSRVVMLPDWQGLGLAFVMMECIAEKYRTEGFRVRMYPSHPGFVRSFQRSRVWVQTKEAGTFHARETARSKVPSKMRPCGVFEYVGVSPRNI
jgi:GNAT superfamily N-acetyltransferase